MFREYTFFLTLLVLRNDLSFETSTTTRIHDQISRRFIETWIYWYQYCKSEKQPFLTSNINILVVVSAFVLHFLTGTLLNESKRIWWMVGLMEKLFDSILKDNVSGIFLSLQDAIADREPLVSL